MVAVVLSGTTETQQRFIHHHDGTLDKNVPQQPIGEEIAREWNNKLIVYKYRLIRLARLGIRHYKLKTKATNTHHPEVYRQVEKQPNQVPFYSTRPFSENGNNLKEIAIDSTGASSGTAGFAGILGERGAFIQEPSGAKWN